MGRKGLMRAGLAVVAIGCVAGAVLAQGATGTIAGKVTDAATGQPIAWAIVQVVGTSAKGVAGKDGRYSVEQVPEGTHRLKCTHPGYAAGSKSGVKVAAGATVNADFALQPAPRNEPVEAEKAEALAAPEPAPAMDRAPGAERKRSPRRPSARPSEMAYKGGGPPRSPRPPPRPRPSPQPVAIAVDGDPAAADFNTEGYDPIKDNPFLAVAQEPLSTFSIDVDTAAYANIRRFIEQSRMPPKDAVRIEEMINYFTYDYPDATGEHPFSVSTEVSSAPWNPEHRLVMIGLQGKKIATKDLPPTNLVFLLDVSGSMNSPDKLPLLKAAFSLLVNSLRPTDRVAIAVYAGAAGLVLPSTQGKHRDKILDALDGLSAGGSTAGGAGIQLAYQVAQDNLMKGGNNRVILATDGDFNVGASSDGDLVRMIEEKRKLGIFLTVLGFGTGNYQDAKMQKLADTGNGNHAYIDSILEAKKVLVTQMGGTLLTIAKDVKIQVELNPAKVKGYRLIGYENRLLRNQDFNDDTKDAGELGAGHTVTVLYEIIPADSKEEIPGVDALKYQKTELSDAAKKSPELMTLKLRYKAPDGETSKLITHPLLDSHTPPANTSANFRFATAVAELGLLLRDSAHKGQASYEGLIGRAKAALQGDAEGYRYEFMRLAEKAALLAKTK